MVTTTLLARALRQHVDQQVRRLASEAATNGTQRRITGQHILNSRISSSSSSSSSSSRNALHPLAIMTRATFVSQSFPVAQASPFDPKSKSLETPPTEPSAIPKKKKKKVFIPRKAAVTLTEKARKFFRLLLENSPDETIGIMLHFDQSKTGEPRMVFSFDFVTLEGIGPDDEGVSLEVLEDGVTPKPPVDSMNDGLPKLYVSGNAFLKVLGAKLDVDTENVIPILYDREGNVMDPND